MNKNLKYLVMLLSVAVILSMLVGSVSAAGRINPGEGSKIPGQGPDGLGISGGGAGGLGSNGYLIIAIIAIAVVVVAVLLIIKFVLPKIRQSN